MSRQVKICIKTKDVIRKVTTVYLMQDGSFSVDVPYCPYDMAMAIKFKCDYSKNESSISIQDMPDKRSAHNRPKMTVHSSGFVQLSGPGIISGVDEQTMRAKGMGIYSNPLSEPIYSGPTVGVDIWGLQKFEIQEIISIQDIVFEEKDFIRKIVKAYPKEHKINTILNTYSFEIFVLPKSLSAAIKMDGECEKITLPFYQYKECPGAIFTLTVIRLKNHESFLGILPFIAHSEFPEKHDFGFMIGSPSGTNLPEGKGDRFNIQVIYPNMAPELTSDSLNFTHSANSRDAREGL